MQGITTRKFQDKNRIPKKYHENRIPGQNMRTTGFFNTFEKTLRSKKPQKTRNKAFGQKLKANIVEKLLASGIFKHLDFSK